MKYIFLVSILFLFFACTDDAWEGHYATDLNITSDQTLWQQLLKQDILSDFREVLDSVKVMNGNKITSVSYADLLNEQYFTIFAPVNGSFDKDTLLQQCATTEGNKLVALRFVMSHLSRTPYSFSPSTDEKVHLLNGKYLLFVDSLLGDVPLIPEKSNLVAKNGIIHFMQGQVPYQLNIYENILYQTEFSKMGEFMTVYQKDSLDEDVSVLKGINDLGETEYVDSVILETNFLLDAFGQIQSEDSTYRMVAPINSGWNAAYAKALTYFKYPANVAGADSLQRFWTCYSLMKDLFFNWNEQESPNDSLISTQYFYKNPEMHVFYQPFSSTGILNGAVPITTSNGIVYQVDNWPFDMKDVFFNTVLVEAEYEDNITYVSKDTFNVYQRQYFADSVSNNGYLEVKPLKVANQPYIRFNIPSMLSGKYDIYLVLLPRTISNPTDKTSNKFSAYLTYLNTSGTTSTTVQCKTPKNLSYFTSKSEAVDSILLGTRTFPTCNYGQDLVTLQVTLKSIVTQKEINTGKYSNTMFIDCLYLKPRQD